MFSKIVNLLARNFSLFVYIVLYGIHSHLYVMGQRADPDFLKHGIVN